MLDFRAVGRLARGASVSLVALAVAAPAMAQDQVTQSEQAVADVTPDDVIVVTARRRAESIRDVPVAVTAYSGAALEKSGALDITALADTTPNVTLEPSRGTNSTLTAFIRGVGQQDPVAGFESGVGLYLDDVYLNRPQAAVLDIYDVERVEVLRGPQGTLYGRNTIGGAVKYVTRRLSSTPQMKVRANLGNYEQADLIVSGSTPITEGLKLGLAGARLSRDGFGRNLNDGRDNYNRDIKAGRATLEFDPSSSVYVKLSGDYSLDRSQARNGHRLITGLLTGAPVLDNVFDTRAGLRLPRQQVEAWGVAGHLEIDLSDNLKLKDIVALRKDKSFAPIDFDSLPAADVDVPAIYRNRQFSNELQLAYDGAQLKGLVGVYYLDANANNIFDVVLATTSPALPGLTASTYGDVDTKTWAVFGDFTYDFTDQLSLSLGGRYTVDKRHATIVRKNLLFGASPELGGLPINGQFPAGRQFGALTSDFTGEKTFKQFTPRASISYKPARGQMLYASYSKGFKGGGFDPRGLSTAAPDINGDGTRSGEEIFDYFLFEPEKVNSYEVGYKGGLFDNRLTFALAGFYADYKDVQVPGSVGAVINGVPTFVGVTTNAGKATFKGVEFEANAALARDFAGAGSRLNLGGTLGYLDAKYNEFITNVAGYNADGTPNPAAKAQPMDVAAFRRIQNTPKWTGSATLDLAVPGAGGTFGASTTVSYRSKTYQFETPSPFLDQDGYALWDANLTWSDGRYSIGLHGKNLLDKRYITSGYQFLAVNPVTGVPLTTPTGQVIPNLGKEGTVTAFYGNPRQLFVSLGLQF